MGKLTLHTTIVKVTDTKECLDLLQHDWLETWKEVFSNGVVHYDFIGISGEERGLEVGVYEVKSTQELRLFSRKEVAIDVLCNWFTEHITSEVVVSEGSVHYINPLKK